MTIEVTYFTDALNPNVHGLPILSEKVTASASSAQSGATPDNATVVRIAATANDCYAYGANPTATAARGANGHYIGSGAVIELQAVPGNKIAVITAT